MSFFAPSRPPFSPRGVRCDFEIKAFYLTSVSDLTYFIYLQANYGQILLPEPISGSLRSPGWSEERTFVSYNVPPVRFGASKTIASTHYSQRGVEVAQDRDRPPPPQFPCRGQTLKLCMALIFANAPCVLPRGPSISLLFLEKSGVPLLLQRTLYGINSCILFPCCKSNKKKSFAMFVKGQHKL